MRLSALLLTAGLLLSGCTGGTPAADNSGAPDGSPLPAESVSPTPTESTDFRKYNAYSDVMSDIYEMDGMLAAYFTAVSYPKVAAFIRRQIPRRWQGTLSAAARTLLERTKAMVEA